MSHQQQQQQSSELSSSIFQIEQEESQQKQSSSNNKNNHQQSSTSNPKSTHKPKPYFFKQGFQIIKEGEQHKVIFGTMQRQSPQTLYEYLKPYIPYLQIITENTTKNSTIAYQYLKNGIFWIYEKLTQQFIPYTVEEVPKLYFVIKDKLSTTVPNNQLIIDESGQFQLLTEEDLENHSFDQRVGKENNLSASVLSSKIRKNTHSADKVQKKRIIVPMTIINNNEANGWGKADEQNQKREEKFMKFLENENYQIRHSFPIDLDDEDSSVLNEEIYMVPSEKFQIITNEAYEKELQREKEQSYKVNLKDQVKPQITQQSPQIKPQQAFQSSPSTENNQKIAYKSGNCYIFELEGKNSIEYQILHSIQSDENTQSGYFTVPKRYQWKQEQEREETINSKSDPSEHSGEVPLMTEKINPKQNEIQREAEAYNQQQTMLHKQMQTVHIDLSRQNSHDSNNQTQPKQQYNQPHYTSVDNVSVPMQNQKINNRNRVDATRKVRVEIEEKKETNNREQTRQKEEKEMMLN